MINPKHCPSSRSDTGFTNVALDSEQMTEPCVAPHRIGNPAPQTAASKRRHDKSRKPNCKIVQR